jgi:hypothetical protein
MTFRYNILRRKMMVSTDVITNENRNNIDKL